METVVKRKLLIIGSSQGVYGGIEAFMIAIAEAAKLWTDFEVKLCFKMVNGANPSENFKIFAEKACSSVHYVNRASPDLFRLIQWAEVLHVQNMPPDVVIPAFVFNKKICLTVHNRRQEKFSLRRLVWQNCLKLVDQRWYNSDFVWNTWEPAKRKGSLCIPTVCKLPENSISVNKRKGFVFIGRWIANKGIEEIIWSYAKADFDYNEWPLTLIGDGPLKNEIICLINKLDLKDKITITGFVNDQEKERILTSSKWLLAPAKTKEDLGLTPIEARAVGVPAIVTLDGGLPESGGAAALMAKPGDVEDLLRCMQTAANMEYEEYNNRAELAKKSLNEYLKPLDWYKEAFE